ncbi:hypothetical protein ISN45_Aa07g006210 [Arabidopsis thaliana x Arabidopsis arenosa]|uniref:Uncharacterized protein n=1 Tax=Arabidopsis thaliana x Arabidopsis arenosa TaxID=1240361 RepID=A0A8T1Y548_9BRAS|nr:hypothetical protein ISN45_Aa07g006210 [Arabidopsis thaliana x Arabidopsis arenosa]
MGNKTSRKSKETSARNYTTELRSYEAACKEDMEIQSFDKRMQARTSHVISTLATGVEVRALSFDSLKVVTECLLDMNQEVVKVILDSKKDIWKNQEMFELVEDYLATSLKTLDFCDALERGLQRVRVSHLLILGALHQFEEENLSQDGNGYKKTLEELKRFKDTERPFDQDFIKMFQSVYKQQMLMLEKLQLCKKKLDKKLKRIHTWRKVSSIIFIATFATMVICSVVAAAMAAPPVAAALAAAMAPLGSMGKWIDSLWKNYENAIKGQKEVISSMQAGTYVAVKDLDNIRDLIERLDIEIRGMVKNAEFAVEHDAVKIGINAIKKKLEVFQKNVEALGTQADICSREIIKARTVIIQRILNHPDNGSCST